MKVYHPSNFIEQHDEKVMMQKFLKEIPGLSPTDSDSYRIEALRVHLETQLGEDDFLAAYRLYSNLGDEEEETTNKQLNEMLGTEKMNYYPLLCHLIILTESFYGCK